MLLLPLREGGWGMVLSGLIIATWASWFLYTGFRGDGFVILRNGTRVTREHRQMFVALAALFWVMFAAGCIVVICGLVTVYVWETR